MYKSIKTYITGSVALIAGILFFSGSLQAQGNLGQKEQSNANAKTVVDVVQSTDSISEFAKLLDKSGFAKVLKQQKGKFTVLAPKNDAIKDMDPKKKKNPQGVVKQQLRQGEMSKDMIEDQMDVKVEKTIDSADNGTVYVVDGLASPPQRQQKQQ